MKLLVYSKIARARGLAQAILESPTSLDGVRGVAAEIVDLLKIEDELPRGDPIRMTTIREADDPLALRASIGGRKEIGYYLTFRGDPEEVLDMLRTALVTAEAMLPAHAYKDNR